MKVVITGAAKRDLAAISDYIGTDNPERALTFVDELLDQCERLSERHGIYPVVPRFERAGVRRCLHRSYLIFYRLRADAVEIIHILHGARDYETLLFGEFGGEESARS